MVELSERFLLLCGKFYRIFMNPEIYNLDLESLKRLYQSKVEELMNNLHAEVSWDHMKELRETLYELSILMYEKVQSPETPEKSKSQTP